MITFLEMLPRTVGHSSLAFYKQGAALRLGLVGEASRHAEERDY
jgi:hypothetical protein